MKKSFNKYERIGLPGGPNELKKFTDGFIISQRGQLDYPGLPTAVPTPSGKITMKGVKDDLLGIDNLGNTQYMTPNNEYQFEGDIVYEIPQVKKGGSKKPSKKLSRSLMAKNRLFAKNPLFKKSKSAKNKIYDPNSPYYDNGGIIDQEEIDAANMAMMKARLAYANEFGNPAAKRMINIPDNPYQFDNGDTGTHYMESYGNYAVPQIQDENGILQFGDYGPESNEAIRFDSDEDANYFAENYKDISPGFLNQKKKGGASEQKIIFSSKGGDCLKDEYWNGTKCVKIPKNTRIVYHTDKDVYDKAFAAESDSSHFYNNAKSDFNKIRALQSRIGTSVGNAAQDKARDAYFKEKDRQEKKWHTDNYKPGTTINHKYIGPKSNLKIKPVGLERNSDGYAFPKFKKPVVHNVYEEPIKEEEIDLRLPPLKSELLPQQNYELQGTYEEDQVPEYSPSYPENRIGYDKYNWYTTKSGLPKRQTNTGGFYPKYSKKVEEIKNYMEGYDDEDGNYIPGEIEKAKEEGRQIKFKGNVSKDDKEAQEKYIQEYGDYENLRNYQNQIMNLMQYNLNQKQYGGLHKFLGGGPTDCGEGMVWDDALQQCVEDTSKYNQQSLAKHLAEKKIYEDALKEIEAGTAEYAILEEAYNAKVKKLEKEKARVLKVRGNVIPASKALDEADDLIKFSNPFYQDYMYAENPKELALARKALPQEIKNVLPNQGLYNVAKWNSKTNKWNEGLHPSRELYCTPYGCFAYQKAGASDVPTIGGNIDFANRAATGDFAFEKINPNERQPGDMALMVEMAPNDYSDPNSGMSRRPHHTTIYAEPDPKFPKDTKKGNFYNANSGSRLNFEKTYLRMNGEPGDRFDYYRYVGAQNKINNEILDLIKQKEEFNIKQEQRKNNVALPSMATLEPKLITQNNTATLQYPKKEETLKPKNKKQGGSIELYLDDKGIKKYKDYGYIVEELPEAKKGLENSGLTDDFSKRLTQFITDAQAQGIDLGIGSGFRSYEKQDLLWKNALKKYGSAEKARKWVAPPGKSNHNKGLAVDLNSSGQFLGKKGNSKATNWAHANANKYGLHFRMSHEPWHIEPIEKSNASSDTDHSHMEESNNIQNATTPEELAIILKNKELEFQQKQILLAEQEKINNNKYDSWQPKKLVEEIDPRLAQLQEYSKIISPSLQNINTIFKSNIQNQMKNGGIVLDLDDADIDYYRKGGYIVEELD